MRCAGISNSPASDVVATCRWNDETILEVVDTVILDECLESRKVHSLSFPQNI